MMLIKDLLMELVKRNGSDLHLKVGRPPLMRIGGDLKPTEMAPLSSKEVEELVHSLLSDAQRERFERDLELDMAYELPGVARFRVNAFYQRGMVGAALRLIPYEVPTIDQLGLPGVLKTISQRRQGMVLVTGPTGCGKSTTLASMIQEINDSRPCHIITIEDPMEFVHRDSISTVNQRELGTDTLNWTEALRRALRQDPDVILFGEIRDSESMELAMHAAETGHLFLSTLHTNDAKQTIDRIVDMFPSDSHNQIFSMLSLTLLAVISQRLLPRKEGNGRIAAMEILINSPHVAELVAKGRTGELGRAMIDGTQYYGMQTLDQHLATLVHDGVVDSEEALANSSSPADLELMLRGLGSGVVAASAVDAYAREEDTRKKRKARSSAAAPEKKVEKKELPTIDRGFQF